MAKWTPSPSFTPGNTKSGTGVADTHQFTGSVTISGSAFLNGVPIGGGGGGSPGGVGNSVQVNDGAGGFEGNSNLKYIPGGGGADALRLTGSVQMTGSIELSGTINQTGSINLFSDVVGGPPFPDISFAPTYEDAGAPSGYVGSRVTIGSVMSSAPAGTEASVINYGSLSCSHGITASSFVGDGSGLTNLPGGGGGGSPGTPLNSIQFNDASSFGGDADFTWEQNPGPDVTWGQKLKVTGNVAFSGGLLQVGGGLTSWNHVYDNGVNPPASSILMGYAGQTNVGNSVYNLEMFYDPSAGNAGEGGERISIGCPNGNFSLDGEFGVSGSGPSNITIGSSGSTITIDGGMNAILYDDDMQAINIGLNENSPGFPGRVRLGQVTASTDGRVQGNWHIYGRTSGPDNATLIVGNAYAFEERNPGYILINDGNHSSTTGSATIYNTMADGLFLSSSKELRVPGGISSSLNITAGAFYGDGANLTNLPGGGSSSPVGPEDSIQFKVGSDLSGSSGLLVRYPGGSDDQWADLVVSGSIYGQRLYGVEDGNGVLTRYQDGLGPFVDVQQEYVILGTDGYGSGPGVDGTLTLGWSTETFASEATASHYHGCFSARTFYNAIDELGGAESGPKDIWAENSNVHRIIYDGDIQLTMTRMTAGASYVLFLANSVGAAAVTYDPTTFKFPGGTVPTNTQVSGAYDIISGISDGTRFYCDMTKNFS